MSPRIVTLSEYEEQSFAEQEISEDLAKTLHGSFGSQVKVDAPSFMNDHRWLLTSQGWVGYIPLTETFHLSLVPKVPIQTLFGMLEYAYKLKFQILEGLADSESISELYERLASVLAKRILDRIRKGLYRSYVSERASLPYLRGRLEVAAHIRSPARIPLPCEFEDHTADLEDNQILLWTLTRILESGTCGERTAPYVRQARRGLLGFASLRPFPAAACSGRSYNRLNQDYEMLHALSRFFLEHTGPTHRLGDRRMVPILVNMDRLFELFVVEWLKQNVPAPYVVHGQEHVQFSMGHALTIRIDITIKDSDTGRTAFVLDTKYKAPDTPAPADVEQVVAYAEAKDCDRAILIYPTELPKQIKGRWGKDIRVESLPFRLDGDLDEAGRAFLDHLLVG